MNKRSILLAFFCLTAVLPLCAKDAVFSNDAYGIALSYTDEVAPGDAVVVRMRVSKNAADNAKGETTASLAAEGLGRADFYKLPVRGLNAASEVELLAALPLSTYQETGSLGVKVIYSPFGGKEMEFELPVTVQSKDFVSETIPLNETNTAIRTDTSPQRTAQIDKLNKILAAVDKNAVYQLEPFTPPTDATRRTAFFGDRRVYAYSNGKNSTSLHYGIDYGVPTGTPVKACGTGRVVLAENRLTTGWSIVIEHLPGLYSLYYHMDSLSVKEGAMVKQGDQIGLSGATGLATGPHLHWEVRLNMAAVNPDFFTEDFLFSTQR